MARSLTILFGVTSRSWGGNEKWALEAARSLRARGHGVKVLWSYAPILEQLEARGLPARRLRLPGDVNPVSFFSFARAVRAERPDVLVLTKQREYWVGGLAARLAGRPLVALRLGLARPLKDDLKRRLSFGRFADLVIVNSRGVADALGASPWFDQRKVRVLLNGVDGSPCDPARRKEAARVAGRVLRARPRSSAPGGSRTRRGSTCSSGGSATSWRPFRRPGS